VDTGRRNRRLRLASGLVLAWAILLLPSLVVHPERQPGLILVTQVFAVTVLISLGRRGWDLLVGRAVLAAVALPIGWGLGQAHLPTCSQSGSCTFLVLGVLIFTVLFGLAMSAVALPMNVVWTRGLGGLGGELPLGRIPVPRSGWQWALVATGGHFCCSSSLCCWTSPGTRSGALNSNGRIHQRRPAHKAAYRGVG
jgi:hypothetical protein